jgi:hypothetical protein
MAILDSLESSSQVGPHRHPPKGSASRDVPLKLLTVELSIKLLILME